MIYLDTSVALAQLFAEDRIPPDWLWSRSLVSSRLLEYEVWVWANARGTAKSHGDAISALLGAVAFAEMTPLVLKRAVEPFPLAVRTFDAFHLASVVHLLDRGIDLELATYDARMLAVAKAMRLPVATL